MNSIRIRRRHFGFAQQIAQTLHLNTTEHLKIAKKDPKLYESPFEAKIVSPGQTSRSLSKLSNGVQVLTESSALPGVVSFGVILNVGSRNEDKSSSGVLHSIKTTYYRSNLNTNETVNYGMVQMTGGNYEMNYDRERSWFKAHCLAHDTVDVFSMMSDCILEPRTAVTASAAMEKLGHSHKLQTISNSHYLITDKILASIYGDEGIGMPILGVQSNIINLNAYTLQKFQIENISPANLTIVGLGVENHGEFIELADNFYGKLKYNAKAREQKPSVFKENDVRTRVAGTSRSDAFVIFEDAEWSNDDMVKSHVARELFGAADVANHYSTGANHGLFGSKIYKQHKFVHSIEAFNMHFTDTGLFGFRMQVNNDSINKSLEILSAVLRDDSLLTETELQAAKKQLKRKIVESVGRDFERLEEYLKHQSIFGEVRVDRFLKQIEDLTITDFRAWLAQLMGGKMAFVIQGSDLANVHSHDKIKELFK